MSHFWGNIEKTTCFNSVGKQNSIEEKDPSSQKTINFIKPCFLLLTKECVNEIWNHVKKWPEEGFSPPTPGFISAVIFHTYALIKQPTILLCNAREVCAPCAVSGKREKLQLLDSEIDIRKIFQFLKMFRKIIAVRSYQSE